MLSQGNDKIRAQTAVHQLDILHIPMHLLPGMRDGLWRRKRLWKRGK